MTTREIADKLIACFDRGNKVLLIGNGGSLEQCNHFSSELVNRMTRYGKPLPVYVLTNAAIITSIANDSSFDQVFARQIEAYGEHEDILIPLTTSGTSQNILNAIDVATFKGLEVIKFPTNSENITETPQTQETHLHMIHEISQLVEDHYLNADI